MNKLLILPGFSIKNSQWAGETVQYFLPQFEAEIYRWKHWETGTLSDFSLKSELQTIVAQLKENQGKTNIIAKSIGTLVLAEVYSKVPEKLNKIILCGVPLNDLSKEEWKRYNYFHTLKKGQVVCFQNSDDPHGSFAQMSKFFQNSNLDIPVIEKQRDDHEYPYFEDFKDFLFD